MASRSSSGSSTQSGNGESSFDCRRCASAYAARILATVSVICDPPSCSCCTQFNYCVRRFNNSRTVSWSSDLNHVRHGVAKRVNGFVKACERYCLVLVLSFILDQPFPPLTLSRGQPNG